MSIVEVGAFEHTAARAGESQTDQKPRVLHRVPATTGYWVRTTSRSTVWKHDHQPGLHDHNSGSELTYESMAVPGRNCVFSPAAQPMTHQQEG